MWRLEGSAHCLNPSNFPIVLLYYFLCLSA
jgi:hypothetical protein